MKASHQRPSLPSLSAALLLVADSAPALDHRPHADNLVPEEYATIQEAIDASTPHDTVTVAPGTYLERIDYGGKSIVVRSAQGPEVTAIDGQYEGLVVDFGEGNAGRSQVDNPLCAAVATKNTQQDCGRLPPSGCCVHGWLMSGAL